MSATPKPVLAPVADTAALLRRLDSLRAAVRLAETTIRRLKRRQNVDTAPVLRALAKTRIQAQRVADDIRERTQKPWDASGGVG